MTRELPLTKGALATVALIFVIAIGGYVGVVAPAGREARRLEAQAGAVEAKLVGAAAAAEPIGAAERAAWRQIDSRLRERFVAPEDQLRMVAEAVENARAAGLIVTDVEVQAASADQKLRTEGLFAVPANFAVNPGVIRLTAQHRYRELVDFLDRLRGSSLYVTIEALDVRRVGGYLQSEIRLVSLRWQPEGA